ncbi:MAG: hypothetical protein ACRDU4_15130, partial [Mycobacterium sp.]
MRTSSAGEYVQARTDRRTELIDPATGEVFGDAPTSGRADVDLAYAAMSRAAASHRMSSMSFGSRSAGE